MKIQPHMMIAALFVGAALYAGAAEPGRVFTNKVVTTPSVVYLRGFHGTAQRGPTCNVYSAWMILKYYRFRISPARLMKDAKDDEYKTSAYIARRMNDLGFEFICFTPRSSRDFAMIVKRSIDNGVPLQWGVDLKLSPIRAENKGKKLALGHARVITGYERKKGELTTIIYADSWGGRRNLKKRLPLRAAFEMTMSVSPIIPKDLDPETAELIRKPL